MVVLNNVTYDYIINIEINHGKNVALPKWLNELEAIDTNVWNKSVKTINCLLRAMIHKNGL